MSILGAHMSIAGGLDRAVQRAAAVGCDCVQIFSKNSNQWKAKPLATDDVWRFRAALATERIAYPLIHDSYLINLASPDEALWQRSIDAFCEEMLRAEQLGVPYVVTHPGAYTTATEEEGLQQVIRALDEVNTRLPNLQARCLIETTAGQGTCLGWRFEHLARILSGVRESHRVEVCFDTCHVWAAGYGLSTRRDYLATMREFDQIVGLERIRAFHLNDSRRERGSRVDRHEHIGSGHIGLDAFGFLLRDRRFRGVPMYLETPKEGEGHDSTDSRNLTILRQLSGGRGRSA